MKRKMLAFTLLLLGIAVLATAEDTKPVKIPGKDKWDKATIPAIIPEYTLGQTVNHGNGGEARWFQVYCEEDKQADVDKYIAGLTGSGWKVKENLKGGKLLEKDGDTLEVVLVASAKLVSIKLELALRTFAWPTKEFPELPVFQGKARSVGYTVYDYDTVVFFAGVAPAAMEAYGKQLAKAGWKGEADYWEYQNGGRSLRLQMETESGDEVRMSVSEEEPE